MFSTFRTKNIHISCLFLPASISDIFPHLERKCTLISCLFLPALPGFDRYSLLSKNYEPHVLQESISGVVPHLKRKIYTYLVCFCQRTLATIDISFGTRITNRTRFVCSGITNLGIEVECLPFNTFKKEYKGLLLVGAWWPHG